MDFERMPAELKALRRWVLWRSEHKEPLEQRSPDAKPTKVPYSPWPNGPKASVNEPNSWGTFEQAIGAPFSSEVFEPNMPVTAYSGVGFELAQDDGYTFIDLDATVDADERQLQQQIYERFDSYSELSPSRNGCHIIVKGTIPHGRRRGKIEAYSGARFMTMTGEVINDKPIEHRQADLDWLYQLLGGDKIAVNFQSKPATQEDAAIIDIAANAANGDKFRDLYEGKWSLYYSSQSEADFALIDITAYYTDSMEQVERIFYTSALGQRDKAKRKDYVRNMVKRAFDRKPPDINSDAIKQQIADMIANAAPGGASDPGAAASGAVSGTAYPNAAGPSRGSISQPSGSHASFPPGLLGEIATYIMGQAPRPVPEIALTGAIAFMAGLCGRSYNVSNTGLNQYILLLSRTGTGKDAMASGIAKLRYYMRSANAQIDENVGPAEIASPQALIRHLAKNNHPFCLSIVGEYGKLLKQMVQPNAPPHLRLINRTLLQLYSKSGFGEQFDPMIYSDRDKNTGVIMSPSFSMLGESVPEAFYEALDESLIADGLLPRFLIVEYNGLRVPLNKSHREAVPSLNLIGKLNDLCGNCYSLASQSKVHPVDVTPEAEAAFDEFERWIDAEINENLRNQVTGELWNRAALKAKKLAALQAVGENYLYPRVSHAAAMWAINMIVGQTRKLLAKFATGLVGGINGSATEIRQVRDVCKVIREYLTTDIITLRAKYPHIKPEPHGAGVITASYLQQRLLNVASMKAEAPRVKASDALKKVLKLMIEAGELSEMSPNVMNEKFGTRSLGYAPLDLGRIMKPDEED